jgi:hypothetical protein
MLRYVLALIAPLIAIVFVDAWLRRGQQVSK